MNAMQQLGLAIIQHECRWRDQAHRVEIGAMVLHQSWDAVLVKIKKRTSSKEVWKRCVKYVETQYQG